MNKLIVFTGPESSGKSTWSKWLSSHFGIQLVEEYARDFLAKTGGKYNEPDLLVIAKKQQELITHALSKYDIVIADTDLLTIKIWSEEKYGKCDKSILDLLYNNVPDHYVLCRPDIPWEEDFLRENPHDRDRLFNIYEQEINEVNIPYFVLGGNEDKRRASLIDFIAQIEN